MSDARFPSDLTLVGDTVYFSAYEGINDRELWKTDGTAAGTARVTDLNPGPQGSHPSLLVESGGRLFFRANRTFKKSYGEDGTPAGTTLIRSGFIGAVTDSAGTLYFTSSGQLFRSNGTLAGTTPIQSLPGIVHLLHPVKGGVAFKMERSTGGDPWFSDGTPGTAVMLLDADPLTRDSACRRHRCSRRHLATASCSRPMKGRWGSHAMACG